MSKYKYTDVQFIDAVQGSFSIASVCRKLGIKPCGGNYRTIHTKIESLSLDTSHFTGSLWNKGLKLGATPKHKLCDILIENSPYTSSSKLKNRLFGEGLKIKECECCGNKEWLGKPIPLELHHINGIKTDNRIENLSIICPNCHSFTDNFRGKNKGMSALLEMEDVECRKVKGCLTSNGEVNLEPTPSNEGRECAESRHDRPKSKPLKTCPNCLSEFYGRSTYCSTDCYYSATKGKRPSVFDLLEKFKELKTFTQVGKYYGVSDNAIRKWCSFYGVNDMVKEYSRLQR